LRLIPANEDAKFEDTNGARGAVGVGAAAVACGIAVPLGPFRVRLAAAYAAASLTRSARRGLKVLEAFNSAAVTAGSWLTTTSLGAASEVVQPCPGCQPELVWGAAAAGVGTSGTNVTAHAIRKLPRFPSPGPPSQLG
jgi:hypothetical protein